jgi:hypothetical protein
MVSSSTSNPKGSRSSNVSRLGVTNAKKKRPSKSKTNSESNADTSDKEDVVADESR